MASNSRAQIGNDDNYSHFSVSRELSELNYHTSQSANGDAYSNYEKYLSMFEGGQVVTSYKEVEGWSERHVAAWVSTLDHGKFKMWTDCIIDHVIDGPVLFEMTIHKLEEIGVKKFGDRTELMQHIEKLQRRCKKPNSGELTRPSYLMCIYDMVTFSWADTSEGKGGLEIKEELVHANTSIALVSTLTWSILGYGRKAAGCVLLLYVYEMSDEQEVETFFDMLGKNTQLPGAFLFVGMICFCVPMASYLIFNVNLGLSPGSNDSGVLALSYVVAIFSLCTFLYGFLYKIPSMISSVYEAKIRAYKKDMELAD
ncbi:hypothetical protein GUITHDRAFT_134906 [Guillardia theta CCMP2712]|uniref:SAM domain-containing protein n=1 Tax=Guillardia theta (strain CCMP2712) TaxID=905079 RepID=L1JRK2_GUITC|nr:hypothetical protein GUITHDRAFT_134906 [Guillardia theta CCMP2712]EKX50790.1 hypothetical protein GUITHDRAFT_134906 [Guillardia theta CCMP2712]|eukprot:XP_005837770.1 hypothetical protein GUITHDRAFT_134906 [Guillardia theta CCMP2712]